MSSTNAAEARRLVRRAHADLGSRTAVADLVRASRAAVDGWLEGTALPTAAQQRVLRDLALVHDRLRTLAAGRVPPGWFRLPCPMLDGATPEDVLVVDGAPRVLAAIDERFG